MNLIEIQKKFNTQARCLTYMEKLRWGKTVICPYCDSTKTVRYKKNKFRHKCYTCDNSFSVLVDTIFENTKLPFTKWFTLIGLILNSKSGLSAKTLQNTLGITYKTAYYCGMRVRVGMLMKDTSLDGIIEMDESYFGGKTRKTNKGTPKNVASLTGATSKRGRGTNKISVAGMVVRKGNVKTKVIEKLSKRNLLAFLKGNVKSDTSILITDGFKSYQSFSKHIEHLQIEHKKQFSKGFVHINSVEGFWSFVKNGLKGNYRVISPKYLPFYLVQFEWQWNFRNYRGNIFEKFMINALGHEKELSYWKSPSAETVKKTAY